MTDSEHRTSRENSRVSRAGREPDGGRAGVVLGSIAGLGAACLLVATVLPVLTVSVRGEKVSGLARSGWELHGPLLPLLAIIAVACAVPAIRGSVAASLGMAAAGVLSVLIVLVGDAPDIGSTGLVPGSLDPGTAAAGPGFYLTLVGGILLLAAGGLLAMRRYEG